jgi:Ser/Thr protein kinase RdoA (MazF antagonist)
MQTLLFIEKKLHRHADRGHFRKWVSGMNSELAAAQAAWPLLRQHNPTLINLSENHSFRWDGESGPSHVLRVHRPGYQSSQSIESELAWLAAMRATAIPVPQAVPGHDGKLLQPLGDRTGVLFRFEAGREPTQADPLESIFRTLGRYAALAHAQVASWTRPAWFTRPRWDAGAILDPSGLWGQWRNSPGVIGATLAVLERLDAALRRDLAEYGDESDRFGLIHADMRLANLLLDAERIVLLDFDDCGFGWLLYDLAAGLSFIETDTRVPGLITAWCDGYQAVRPLPPAAERMIPVMILLRRMALLAWIGSHGETALAQAHAGIWATDTARLATGYLAARDSGADAPGLSGRVSAG